MHGFEQGDLIVRPNWLFCGESGCPVGNPAHRACADLPQGSRPGTPSETFVDLNGRYVFLDSALKWRPLQFVCTLPFLAGLVVVIMAGLLGTKVGGRNAAIMFTWVGCMSILTIVLVPLGGRIWCTICPLPVLGEYLQRGETTQVRMSSEDPAETGFSGWDSPGPSHFATAGCSCFSSWRWARLALHWPGSPAGPQSRC